MIFKYKITLFTPTYNRGYILDSLYRSVKRQTFRDFEWIIMDDGSTDNTEELVRGWMEDGNDFPIRFYKVPNGGKCRAINRGLDLAEGELFFVMDSDDYLTDDSLENVVKWEATIAGKPGYCGVAGNCGSSPTETPNTLWPEPYRDAGLLERYSESTERPIDGERAFVFYTDFHRQYKYPEFDGENFMGEAVAWNRMARDGYVVRFYNDIIWVFEYKEDGLTRAGASVFLKNPRGYGLLLREKAAFQNRSKWAVLKMWYTFTCDLSSLYSSREIAEYIGAPYLLIAAINSVHKLIHFVSLR